MAARRSPTTATQLFAWNSTEPRTLSAYNILNFRANKDFRLTGTRRISLDFDIFNLLNSATPTGAEFASGPTFGYATGVTPPLITRIGARFNF